MKMLFGPVLLLALSPITSAQTPENLQADLSREARAADPRFADFSAARGAAFFTSRHGGDWTCASCHTEDPRRAGRHAVTGKTIEPLAPVAHPTRFTDSRKVDKWFRRNCNDVVGRECTIAEKGDVLTYLLSLGH